MVDLIPEEYRRMQRLQIAVCAVAGVARPVIGQAQDLVGGRDVAARDHLGLHRIGSGTIFVEIVAEMVGQVAVARRRTADGAGRLEGTRRRATIAIVAVAVVAGRLTSP